MNDMFRNPVKRPLRPHQVKAIDMLRQSLAKGNKRVVLQAATGFGKTLTAATIIERALAKGKRVMFTVPRVSLVNQSLKEFQQEGISDIGVIQSDHPMKNENAMLQIASVQTLGRRDKPLNLGLVIVDEAHETYQEVYNLMALWPDVPFVGLSATPWAVGMGKHWQDLVQAISLQELIDLGYLSKFKVLAPDVPDLSRVKVSKGEFSEAELEEIMGGGKLVASVLETWLDKGEDRPTFCFGVNRAHAKALCQSFNAAGVSAGYCDAYTDKVEMMLLERQFRAGDIRVMCSVIKMTTGIDWPVSCIIDAAPTRSEMRHVQKIGRGLRVNKGTEDLIVLDHAGNTLRLGLVTDIHHETLDMGDKKAKRDAKPKAEKLPKQCANCGAVQSAKVCEFCGHEVKGIRDIETVDGHLTEVTGKVKLPSMEEKQAAYSGLIYIAREKGYSDGWAYHKYKEKFNVAPANTMAKSAVMPSQDLRNWVKSRQIAYAKARGK